jgi:hypothetical protein
MFEDCPDIYLNYLQECGVNIELKTNMQFNDKL